MSGTDVVKFYENKNILITGAAGFLGKVLLWKLLKSCPNVGKIYVLLRAKHSCSAEQRINQIIKTQPFTDLDNHADLYNRIVAIDGDLTTKGLGISQTDTALLQEQVNIVFHCAASVKFDAPLKDNMRDNLYGTREIVDLCNGIRNLNALVHVSTAYSNCHKKDVVEELVPINMDIEQVIQLVE